MKTQCITIVIFLTLATVGCELTQVIRPLRLYNLSDGKTIEVFLRHTSPRSGKLVSAREGDEKFEGEIILLGEPTGYRRPLSDTYQRLNADSTAQNFDENVSLSELYGYGKGTNVRPVGTAVLVGSQGTMIEIVLYSLSPDLQYGDGVAKDNKGKRYRVFLSVEE